MELEVMLSKVNVVVEANLDTNRVGIGLTVSLQDLDSKKDYTYTLVNSEELFKSANRRKIEKNCGEKLFVSKPKSKKPRKRRMKS